MSAIDRRRFLLLAGMAGLAACSDNGESDATSSSTTATPGSSTTVPAGGETFELLGTPRGILGLMDEAAYQARVEEYLAFAGAEEHPDNPTGIAVHLIRAQRDPAYTWGIDEVTVDSLAEVFELIDAWDDTRDFNLMYFHWLWALGQGDTDMTSLQPAVLDAIEERIVANRYRYDDPLPDDRIDNLWYWSENHRLIGLAIELPGRPGLPRRHLHRHRAHRRRAPRSGQAGDPRLDRRAGPLRLLRVAQQRLHAQEHHPAADAGRAGRRPGDRGPAAMALDLCLVDVAAHHHAGSYVAPHGRTYKKDKMTSLRRGHLRHGQAALRPTPTRRTSRPPTPARPTWPRPSATGRRRC